VLPPSPADLVVLGPVILAFDGEVERAAALAVSDGRVLATGTREEILALAGAGTRTLALPEGAVAVPGLIDAHAHLLGLGLQLSQLDLAGAGSEGEVVDRARAHAAGLPQGAWVEGRGWDQNDWAIPSFPGHETLTDALPDHPAFLVRIDGHAAWVNARALEAAGISAATPDPAGGRILRDPETMAPTGILVDSAVELVRDLIPAPTVEEREALLLKAQAACHRVGLTGMHEAGVGADTLQAFRNLEDTGRLRLRVHAMLGYGEVNLAPFLAAGPIEGPWLAVRSVKAYMDGALGSRGAALLEAYSDEGGNQGLITADMPDLLRTTMHAFEAGFQVCIHAIGDRANRLALDLFADALARTGAEAEAVRPRIEHAQVLSTADIGRFADLGVVASMQPTHCTSDMDWADERLGPERLDGAYAWRSVLESGALLAFGSDFPVERPHPLEGVYAAVTRQHRDGTPEGGFRPRQRLTVAEALAAFTTGAARAAFEEERLGRLRPGYAADLVVLGADPTAAGSPADLLETAVLLTMVGGEVVYSTL
jgi:predicted amidohydrolase YtcJ